MTKASKDKGKTAEGLFSSRDSGGNLIGAVGVAALLHLILFSPFVFFKPGKDKFFFRVNDKLN